VAPDSPSGAAYSLPDVERYNAGNAGNGPRNAPHNKPVIFNGDAVR